MSQVAARQALDFAMLRSSAGQPWLCDRVRVHTPGVAQDIRFDPPRDLSELMTGPVAQALQVASLPTVSRFVVSAVAFTPSRSTLSGTPASGTHWPPVKHS